MRALLWAGGVRKPRTCFPPNRCSSEEGRWADSTALPSQSHSWQSHSKYLMGKECVGFGVSVGAPGCGETRVRHVLLAPCGGCTSQARASIARHMTQVARPKCRHVRRVVARHGWVMFCSRLATRQRVRLAPRFHGTQHMEQVENLPRLVRKAAVSGRGSRAGWPCGRFAGDRRGTAPEPLVRIRVLHLPHAPIVLAATQLSLAGQERPQSKAMQSFSARSLSGLGASTSSGLAAR
jgi:hypothetical protein